MWVTMREMAEMSAPGDFAIGAFHAVNLEQVQGILEAAVEERAPVIIAVDEPGAMSVGLGPLLAIAQELAREVPVPVSVLLDRVHDVDLIYQALALGYSGVLWDLREVPRDQSIENLLKIKKKCDDAGAFLEVDICEASNDGQLEEIAGIASKVNLDSICISVGINERETPGEGLYNRIEKVIEDTGLLVSLAGAGRWPQAGIRRAVESGAWKMSVATRINIAFTEGLKSYLRSNPDRINPRSYLGFARDQLREEVRGCIREFGSTGKV